MPNLKPVIIESEKNKEGKYHVKIRVTHKGKPRYLKTNLFVFWDEFDEDSGRVSPKHPNSSYLNIKLNQDLIKYEQLILKLDGRERFMEVGSLMHYLKESDKSGLSFTKYIEKHIKSLKGTGRGSYASTFERTRVTLENYWKAGELAFEEITPKFLKGAESWYLRQGNKLNAWGLHARNIRTLFNSAITDELVDAGAYPFRKYKIKKEETMHRDLSVNDIKAFLRAELKTPQQEVARDRWELSMLLLGMNYKDMLEAKPDQYRKGRFHYSRSKTKRGYSVKVCPRAKELIKKYKGEKYLLRFMDEKEAAQEKKERLTPLYKDILDQDNRKFKRMAPETGINAQVSTYWARHSMATIWSNILKVRKDIIELALGHGSNKVTDIYINKSLDEVDEANERFIGLIYS